VNWEKWFLDSTLHYITEGLNRYQHSFENHKLCTVTNILFEIWYCNIVSFFGLGYNSTLSVQCCFPWNYITIFQFLFLFCYSLCVRKFQVLFVYFVAD